MNNQDEIKKVFTNIEKELDLNLNLDDTSRLNGLKAGKTICEAQIKSLEKQIATRLETLNYFNSEIEKDEESDS